ncbi:unnamed protein product [Caretta caretta]
MCWRVRLVGGRGGCGSGSVVGVGGWMCWRVRLVGGRGGCGSGSVVGVTVAVASLSLSGSLTLALQCRLPTPRSEALFADWLRGSPAVVDGRGLVPPVPVPQQVPTFPLLLQRRQGPTHSSLLPCSAMAAPQSRTSLCTASRVLRGIQRASRSSRLVASPRRFLAGLRLHGPHCGSISYLRRG